MAEQVKKPIEKKYLATEDLVFKNRFYKKGSVIISAEKVDHAYLKEATDDEIEKYRKTPKITDPMDKLLKEQEHKAQIFMPSPSMIR